MITAVTATAAVLLAGCGTRAAGGKWRSRPAPAVMVSGAAGMGREPPAGSPAEARALASRLLSGLVLAPGARQVSPPTLPPPLRHPQGPRDQRVPRS